MNLDSQAEDDEPSSPRTIPPTSPPGSPRSSSGVVGYTKAEVAKHSAAAGASSAAPGASAEPTTADAQTSTISTGSSDPWSWAHWEAARRRLEQRKQR